MRDKKSWLLVILIIVGLIACATMQSGVKGPSLPNDINIISPSPDLSKEIAVFSGKWAGTWIWLRSPRAALLIVEEIDKQEAKIIYAVGPYGRSKGEYIRIKAKVIPGSPARIEFFNTETKSDITFEMRKNLKSLAVFFISGRTSEKNSTVFERVD